MGIFIKISYKTHILVIVVAAPAGMYVKSVSIPVRSGLGVQSIVTGAEKGKHAHPSIHWPLARSVRISSARRIDTANFATNLSILSVFICGRATVAWGRGLLAQ